MTGHRDEKKDIAVSGFPYKKSNYIVMKKLIKIIAVMLMVFSINGCFSITHNQHGYPEKVKFSKDGGERIISGEVGLYYFSIENNNGGSDFIYMHDSEVDEFSLQYEWLTVIHNRKTHQFKLIAEPNTTKKKRKLIIGSQYYDTFLDIFVTQSK